MTYELVYASHVVLHLDPRFVAEMVRRARARNRALGITGLLLFDGDRFCQLLEGPEDKVKELAAAIGRDPRHHGFTVLHEGPQPGGRRFAGWDMAFGPHDDSALADLLARRSGPQMADYLQGLVSAALDTGERPG